MKYFSESPDATVIVPNDWRRDAYKYVYLSEKLKSISRILSLAFR